MEVNRRKIEYMCVNESQTNGTVKMARRRRGESEGFQVSVQCNEECGREGKKRVQ